MKELKTKLCTEGVINESLEEKENEFNPLKNNERIQDKTFFL